VLSFESGKGEWWVTRGSWGWRGAASWDNSRSGGGVIGCAKNLPRKRVPGILEHLTVVCAGSGGDHPGSRRHPKTGVFGRLRG